METMRLTNGKKALCMPILSCPGVFTCKRPDEWMVVHIFTTFLALLFLVVWLALQIYLVTIY